jgi:DNA replication protein DnaC
MIVCCHKERLMSEYRVLETQLNTLRLTGFVQQYRRYAEDAARTNQPYEQYLEGLAAYEVARRTQARQERAVRAARFPVAKELAAFDFTCVPRLNKARVLELAQCQYLAQAESIILVGNPGLGKTHLATALGLAACRRGYAVRFFTAASLVNELLAAQAEHRIEKLLAQARKQQLVILDELGFIPFSERGSQLLFQFCSAMHEQVSLLITTNLRFGAWTQVFGNDHLTAALIDRLTHRATILEFIGESYRFRERLQRDQTSGGVLDGPTSAPDAADHGPEGS